MYLYGTECIIGKRNSKLTSFYRDEFQFCLHHCYDYKNVLYLLFTFFLISPSGTSLKPTLPNIFKME